MKLKEGYELNYENGIVILSKDNKEVYSSELIKENFKDVLSSIINILQEQGIQESSAKIESIMRMFLSAQEPAETDKKIESRTDISDIEDIRLKVILISTSIDALKLFLDKIGFPKSFADKATKVVQLAELTTLPQIDDISITFWILMTNAFKDHTIIEGSDFIFVITDDSNKDITEILGEDIASTMKKRIINFTYNYTEDNQKFRAIQFSTETELLQIISDIIKSEIS